MTGVLSAILGSQSEFTAGWEITESRTKLFATAGVKNGKIQAARQAVEHRLHIRQREMNLVHVAADHDMRQAAGAAQCLNVLLRRLRMPLIAQWESAA